MVARDAFSGDADGRFERVVCGAVLGGAYRLKGLGAHAMVGWLVEDGRRVVVLRVGSEQAGDPARFAERGEPMELLWVGGTAEDVPALERTLLHALGPDGRGWLVPETGDPVALGDSPPVGPSHALITDTPPDWARFWEEVDGVASKGVAARPAPPELRGFDAALAARSTRGTVGLLVALFAVYALGTSFGAPEYVPAYTRMGSLYHPRVHAGEVWRLWSSGFLHVGIWHLAMNALVLWQLGREVERLLGTPRFLVLYALSGLGGGFLSLLLTDGNSAGASGALWGLMTARLVFAFRAGTAPEEYRRKRQGAVIKTVLVNGLISLAPAVDAWGHAGGGLVGAALAYTGLLTRGLPRWTESDPGDDHVPASVAWAARAVVVAMAASVMLAVGVGRPWDLGPPGPLVPTRIGSWSVDVPAGLRAAAAPGEATSFGEFSLDPAVVWVTTQELPGRAPEEGIRAFVERIGAAEEGMELVGDVVRDDTETSTLLSAHFRAEHVRLHRTVVLGDGGVVTIDVARWHDSSPSWDTLARDIALSAKPVEGAVAGD